MLKLFNVSMDIVGDDESASSDRIKVNGHPKHKHDILSKVNQKGRRMTDFKI